MIKKIRMLIGFVTALKSLRLFCLPCTINKKVCHFFNQVLESSGRIATYSRKWNQTHLEHKGVRGLHLDTV